MEKNYEINKVEEYHKQVIVVTMNKETLEGFSGFKVNNPELYFKEHKRAKKPPMESLWGKTRPGLIPSINKFLNCSNRTIQNQWEQHLKSYCEYCMRVQGIKHNFIEECVILVVTYKPTRSESDPNNQYVKPFEDAMVERELIKDDNYNIVKFHAETMVYCKENPRSEIRIYPITKEYDFDFAFKVMQEDVLKIHKFNKN